MYTVRNTPRRPVHYLQIINYQWLSPGAFKLVITCHPMMNLRNILKSLRRLILFTEESCTKCEVYHRVLKLSLLNKEILSM